MLYSSSCTSCIHASYITRLSAAHNAPFCCVSPCPPSLSKSWPVSRHHAMRHRSHHAMRAARAHSVTFALIQMAKMVRDWWVVSTRKLISKQCRLGSWYRKIRHSFPHNTITYPTRSLIRAIPWNIVWYMWVGEWVARESRRYWDTRPSTNGQADSKLIPSKTGIR